MEFELKKYLENIEIAIKAGGKIWENDALVEFKSDLKAYYRDQLDEQCCYCRKNTLGEFKMVLDIEHVLPKSKFQDKMFSLFNLSISCKRCNMNIKGEDVTFITDIALVRDSPEDPRLYKFLHPNLDDYFSHIRYITKTINQKKIVKYQILADSEKGQFTYNYFQLSELEIDSFDAAQGMKEKERLSDLINSESAKKIEQLLKNK